MIVLLYDTKSRITLFDMIEPPPLHTVLSNILFFSFLVLTQNQSELSNFAIKLLLQ